MLGDHFENYDLSFLKKKKPLFMHNPFLINSMRVITGLPSGDSNNSFFFNGKTHGNDQHSDPGLLFLIFF